MTTPNPVPIRPSLIHPTGTVDMTPEERKQAVEAAHERLRQVELAKIFRNIATGRYDQQIDALYYAILDRRSLLDGG